jgi:hypothetical protein
LKPNSPYFKGIKGMVTSIEWSTDNHHAIMCLEKREVIIYNMIDIAIVGIIPIEDPRKAYIVDEPRINKYIII